MPKGQLSADTGELIFSVYIHCYTISQEQVKQRKKKMRLTAAATDEQSSLPKVMLGFLLVQHVYSRKNTVCDVLNVQFFIIGNTNDSSSLLNHDAGTTDITKKRKIFII